MSHQQVDLLKESTKADVSTVCKTFVAVFREEPKNPRVMAESEAFLVYTLKNGRTVRIIQRSNNMKGSLRVHAQAVHSIRFVNFRSNVAASAGEGEFYVWAAVDENPKNADPATALLTAKIYFKLRDTATVGAFAFFINAQAGFFDMLVLYDKKVAVLESSKIMDNFQSEPLDASLAANSREVRELAQSATTASLCCVNNTGWFAFTMEPTLVAACTQRNCNTPAWAPCEGQPVINLELLDLKSPEDPTVLVACSSAKCYQWELTGDSEPRLVRTFSLGGAIVTMLSSRTTFILFNDKKQVAMIEFGDHGSCQSTLYEIDTAVRPRSVCFNRKASYGSVLVDALSQVELYQLGVNQGKQNSTTAAAPAVSSPTTAAPKKEEKRVASPVMDPAVVSMSGQAGTAAATKTASTADTSKPATTSTSSHIKNLMEQIQRGNVRATPPKQAAAAPSSSTTASSAVAAPAAVPSSESAVTAAARAALLANTALPQGTDGPLASATHASDEVVRRELESLHNISKNITQILQLTPDQIARDHEQLVNLALEAQMTELQSSGATVVGSVASTTTNNVSGNGNGGGAARDVTNDAFNSYVTVKLLASVANDIARGVTVGIRNTLRAELDNAIRDALGANVREAQKRALKKRLDEVLVESTTHFSEEVRVRLADFANRDLKDVFTQVNISLTALVDENRRLQTSLNDIMRSGALEQLQTTQRELQALKAELASGNLLSVTNGAAAGNGVGANPSAFQSARPNPETILSTARGLLLNEGKTREAMEYIVLARQPAVTLRLLKSMPGDVAMLLAGADSGVSDDLLIDVLTQVSQPAAMDGASDAAEDAAFVAELLFDVVCEKDSLTTMKSAKAQSLMSNIRHFAARQKQVITTTEGQRVLRDLEKCIQ